MTIKNRETFTRRSLPHWYRPGAAHFLTYRLAGTIPADVILRWRDERRSGIDAGRNRLDCHREFFRQYDNYLDRAEHGRKWLADERIASMIRENLYHHDSSLYHLIAFIIMSNHVHVVCQPNGDEFGECPAELHSDEFADGHSVLSRICHSLKSYTANQANKLLGRSGQFWQHETYDHWVRNEDELARIITYIHRNSVKAGLCDEPHLYRWSSIYDLHQQTGQRSGALWYVDT